MTIKTKPLLLSIGAALSLALAALWLRGTPPWVTPTPIPPAPDAMTSAQAFAPHNQLANLPQTALRPLLSADRKPHPQELAPNAAQAAEKDPFENIVFHGIFSSSEKEGGIIVKVDDKTQRLKVNQSLGSWRLVSIKQNVAQFEGQNKEARSITLKYLAGPKETAKKDGSGNTNATEAAPNGTVQPGVVQDIPPAAPAPRKSLAERRAEREARRTGQM